MADRKELTVPCGLDCFNCELYEDNLTDILARLIHDKLGVPEDEVACKRIGLDRWIEEAGQIRKNYFTGIFAVGKGQAD